MTSGPSPRTGSRENPLDGVERLLVDGTNLLHALRRGAPAAPAATLIGRLRGVIELPVRIELVFDGPPDHGLGRDRIASGLTVRYGGRQSADAVLGRMVVEASEPSTLLVVTDDVDLRHELAQRGARTAGARWLIGRLERSRLVSPSVGRPKPPPQTAAASDEGAGGTGERAGWRPGRGATTKHGNPRRRSKSDRGAGPGR